MGDVVKIIGDVMGGNAQASADRERAMELKQQATLVTAQAKEQQAARQTDLQRTIGAINALTASRGLNTNSASAAAYRGGVKTAANTDTATIGANAALQSGMLRESATAAYLAASNASQQGWFTAAGDFTNDLARAAAAG